MEVKVIKDPISEMIDIYCINRYHDRNEFITIDEASEGILVAKSFDSSMPVNLREDVKPFLRLRIDMFDDLMNGISEQTDFQSATEKDMVIAKELGINEEKNSHISSLKEVIELIVKNK